MACWIRNGRSEVVVVAVGESLLLSLDDFLLHLLELVLGDVNLTGSEQRSLRKCKLGIASQSTEEPHEWLLELVVALGRDIVVLEVLLAVESNLLGLHFTVTHIDFVTDEDDGDGLANTGQILVPLGHVGVGDAGANVEHDDTALATDVVTITESSEFLLTGSIPHVEDDLTVVSEEGHGVHLDSESGDVALLELTSEMALHEGSLADTTITNKNELELGDLLCRLLLNHLFEKKRE